jgi:hypothetical protein
LIDPFDNRRTIGTHVEDVSEAERQKRVAESVGGSCRYEKGPAQVMPGRPIVVLEKAEARF